MADHTKIEWTDATWNPITGCSVVSPGCTNCYAMQLAGTRLKNHESRRGLTKPSKAGPVWTGEVRFNPQWLDQPLRWKKPRMIFVCAHGDLFAEGVPDEWIDQVFAVMALSPQHTFQVLTKRPERMREYLTNPGTYGRVLRAADPFRAARPALGNVPISDTRHMTFWPHVWLGVSVEDQRRADERIPILLDTPAAIRWISAEPMLSEIKMSGVSEDRQRIWDWLTGMTGVMHPEDGPDFDYGPKIDWVVAGGESGPHARPMHPDWVRSLRDQCAAAGTPFLFKQWGEWGMPTDTLGALDWPYHKDADRTYWFDSNTCIRPIEDGWDDKYHSGTVRALNPGVQLFQTPEYLDQVKRCAQAKCREAGKCMGNDSRSAVTWVGKKKAGRHLDGVLHDGFPEIKPAP